MNRAASNIELHSGPADRLLHCLEGVQRAGSGWRTRCPAHGSEKNRALSVTVGDDGRVLMHCFAGCSAADVLAAIGLTLGDLFPKRLTEATPQERRKLRQLAKQSQWAAALEVLEFEARIVLVAADQITRAEPLNDSDRERLGLALERINGARRVLNGR